VQVQEQKVKAAESETHEKIERVAEEKRLAAAAEVLEEQRDQPAVAELATASPNDIK
jgi:hypothetical protein